jgi:hypothetical protein
MNERMSLVEKEPPPALPLNQRPRAGGNSGADGG